jgi:hypothetical protein
VAVKVKKGSVSFSKEILTVALSQESQGRAEDSVFMRGCREKEWTQAANGKLDLICVPPRLYREDSLKKTNHVMIPTLIL